MGDPQVSSAARFERLLAAGVLRRGSSPSSRVRCQGYGIACGHGDSVALFRFCCEASSPSRSFSAWSIRTGFFLQGDVMLQGFN